MKPFTNINVDSLDEATRVAAEVRRDGRAVSFSGGGSDLLGMVKERLVTPDVVVNLRTAAPPPDERVVETDGGLRVSGLVTLDALAHHALVRDRYPVLAEAADGVATPQIRHVGTLAGNLSQRPWCWYYRNGFPCYKAGGRQCFSFAGENQFHAIFGGGPSYIVHPSDTAPALVALDATIVVRGPDGERRLPAAEFFVLPRRDATRENVLAPDEVLTAVELPGAEAGMRSVYLKTMDRESWTHAIVSVAAVASLVDGTARTVRLVFGGVAPVPWRVPEAEAIVSGRRLTPEVAREAGRVAVAGAQPLSKNGYKVGLAQALVERALLSLRG